MKKQLTVRVTQDHIDAGVPQKCGKCPVALALIDAGLEDAEVGYDAFWYKAVGLSWPVHSTPLSASAFIRAFDDGLPVSPFEFDVEVESL